MRTTVVDENAKLMVTNGIVQVIGTMSSSQSIHAWLKAHIEEYPAERHELIIGDKVVIELGAGEASRADLTKHIVEQFNRERMNFGEDLRLRLIAVSSIEQKVPEPAQVIAEPLTNDRLPSDQEMWMVTRLPQSDLEAIVERSLTEDTWRVIIAYCELQRRNRSLDPKLIDGLYQLAIANGFSHNGELIEDLFKQLQIPHFGALLDKLSRFSRVDNVNDEKAREYPGMTGTKIAQSIESSSSAKNDDVKEQKPLYKIWWIWLIALSAIAIYYFIPTSAKFGLPSCNDLAGKYSGISEMEGYMDGSAMVWIKSDCSATFEFNIEASSWRVDGVIVNEGFSTRFKTLDGGFYEMNISGGKITLEDEYVKCVMDKW
jgi:hypothetical protein